MGDDYLDDLEEEARVGLLAQATQVAVGVLRDRVFPRVKPEARKKIMLELARDYCDLCMGEIPCRCSPAYDF